MASANINKNCQPEHDVSKGPGGDKDIWRFPASKGREEKIGQLVDCVCAEATKQAKPCRPLAKPTGIPELDDLISDWLRWDRCDSTRTQIVELTYKNDIPELRSRLGKRLKFGTAGLRAPMGAGFARINDLTVIQASQGLLRYMRLSFPDDLQERGIVIGYDGRHNSKRFAQRVASVFLHARIRVRLFSEVVPTPWVPYAILKYKASGGVMITASHNPKQDNGYKIYWQNGSQIVTPHDLGIEDTMKMNLEPWSNSWDLDITTIAPNNDHNPGTPAHIAFKWRSNPFNEVWDSYFVDVKKEIGYNAETMNRDARRQVVHTSMHGVAHKFAKQMFKTLELPKFIYPWSQFEPDGDFPTLPRPNPEEGEEALKLALQTADENDITVVIANDPDADRLGVAEKQQGGDWRIFTGNEIASIFAYWILRQMKESEGAEALLENCYMLASTVSTRMPETMARAEGFQFEETLTGFKWMGNRATQLRESGHRVLFAFEEAIGYMATPECSLEKDGISAAAMLGEILAYLEDEQKREDQAAEEGEEKEKAEGEEEEQVEKIEWTLGGILDHIYTTYGYHLAMTSYFLCYDNEKIKAMFDRIRTMGPDGNYPQNCGQFEIKSIRDLTTGYDNSMPNNTAVLPVNKSSQMITVNFSNGCRATLRTSGTEPKVKYYAEMIGNPKRPFHERKEGGDEGSNANQETGPEPVVQNWDLSAEKTRIKEELDQVVKAITDEWIVL